MRRYVAALGAWRTVTGGCQDVHAQREKVTAADMTFPEKKDNEGGDFYCSHFGVEKPRVKFPFSDILWNAILTVGYLSGPSSQVSLMGQRRDRY